MPEPTSPPDSVDGAHIHLPAKLPDAWLKDIKDSVRESKKRLIITTILGSSLLSGLLGVVGNYFLEGHKLDLQFKKLRVERKLESYSQLAKDIQALEAKIIVARVSSLNAADGKIKIELALDQINQLANHVAIVQDRVKDQNLSDPDGPRARVEKWLDPVAEKILAVQNSENQTQPLKDLATFLKNLQANGIPELKAKIGADEQRLHESL